MGVFREGGFSKSGKSPELGDQTDIFQTKDEGKWGPLASGRDDGNIHLSLLAFFGSSMTSKIK